MTSPPLQGLAVEAPTATNHLSSNGPSDKDTAPPPPPSPALCGGKLCFSPQCLQHAQTAKWLLFWMCVAAAVQGMVVNGFVNVSITSIEKRFKLMSRSTGLIAGFYDIACVIVSVPVSYMGSRPTASKPRWVGLGLMIMGLGSFVFLLPHFLVGFYEIPPEDGGAERSSSVNCNAAQNFTGSGCDTSEDHPGLSNFQYVFILAQCLQGLGAVPLYTIGVAYIDESVPTRLSSLYLGIFYSMAVVGPAIGYGLGGQFLNVYVDAPYVDPAALGITPSSDRWLGGWWMGFFVSGTLAILAAIPILMMPAVLPKTDDDGPRGEAGRGEGATKESEDDSVEVVASGATAFQHLEGLHVAVLSLLKNVPFVALSVGESTEGFLISGLAAFMPKIIETQFGLSASLSAILVGAMAIPAGGGGTFLGGWIIKKFKMQYSALLKLCFSVSLLSLLCCFFFFLYCPNNKFAGVSIPYQMQLEPPSYPDLSSACNTDCGCNGVSYNPVCGADDVIYYSPCHAGCTNSVFKDGKEVFSGCSCIVNAHNFNSSESLLEQPTIGPGQASIDTCPNTCDLLVGFMIILFVLMGFTFFMSMPNVAATLRSVEPEHRALALGLQGISFRMVGTIPAPILFGVAIDNSCVLWQDSCGAQGSCVAYNNYYMTRYIMALGFAAKFVSCVSFFVAWRWYQTPHPSSDSAQQPDGNGVTPSLERHTGGPVLQDNSSTQNTKSAAELMTYDNLAVDYT